MRNIPLIKKEGIKLSTVFPNATQSFKHWEDLTQAQLTAYVNYVNALNQGQWNQARQIFQYGDLSNAMLPTAEDFNAMCDTILECKRLYEAPTTSAQGIQDFMRQFAYKGEFNPSDISQYKKFTLIKYMDVLYMATTDITSTTTPFTNTSQWIGVRPVSYTNTMSTYRGGWNGNTLYVTGDVVIYKNVMYIAKNDNDHSEPSITSSDWYLNMDFNPYIAQISPTQPTNLSTGAIWFKEL